MHDDLGVVALPVHRDRHGGDGELRIQHIAAFKGAAFVRRGGNAEEAGKQRRGEAAERQRRRKRDDEDTHPVFRLFFHFSLLLVECHSFSPPTVMLPIRRLWKMRKMIKMGMSIIRHAASFTGTLERSPLVDWKVEYSPYATVGQLGM